MRTVARRRSLALLTTAAVVPLVLGGCSKKDEPAATGGGGGNAGGATSTAAVNQGITITINNFAFEPQDAQAKVGQIVTWKNEQLANHTVTEDVPAEQRNMKSDKIGQGQTYQISFSKPGTYKYICSVHPDKMKGTVTVS